MNILQVIHGYPPFYMAGSEVYTRNLCRMLARDSGVHVFTRVENSFAPPYTVTTSREDGVAVTRVNKPARDYTLEDKYLDARIDDLFRATVARVRPDVVHIGHLSHLSTHLPIIAKREFGLPVVHTVHDFWLQCVRGQLVRADLTPCQGPSDDACTRCLRDTLKHHASLDATTTYRAHMQRVLGCIDHFLAPSKTVGDFLIEQGVEPGKVIPWPYGLDVSRIQPRVSRREGGHLRFGFMGRVIPGQGRRFAARSLPRAPRRDHARGLGTCQWLAPLAPGPLPARLEGHISRRIRARRHLDGPRQLRRPRGSFALAGELAARDPGGARRRYSRDHLRCGAEWPSSCGTASTDSASPWATVMPCVIGCSGSSTIPPRSKH
jgi:glycosyltransferase involved in cell wall biosynthesis